MAKGNKNLISIKLVFARFSKLFSLVAFIIILVLGYFFIIQPRLNDNNKASRVKLDTVKIEKQRRELQLEKLEELSKIYNSFSKDELAKINGVLPKDKDIAGLFTQFDELTLRNGFLLTSISINDVGEEKGEKIKKLSVNLNVVGPEGQAYSGVKRFLDALEKNNRILDVDSVFFSPDSSAFSVNLTTYYY